MNSDEHPVLLELASLRSTLSRFQQESHSAALKLQHQALDSSTAHERVLALERQLVLISTELDTLRVNPPSPWPPESPSRNAHAQSTAQELTLALRRLSDTLTQTEAALLSRTTELAHARSETARARTERDSAYALAAKAKVAEEDIRGCEREMEARVRRAEEESRMSDLVVREYADLVRSLEGRTRRPSATSSPPFTPSVSSTPASSSTTLASTFSEGKSGLAKLLAESNAETSALHAALALAHSEIGTLEARLDAETTQGERDREDLAQAQVEMEKMKMDDGVAARMVERYMTFSQQTITKLHASLDSLSTRHAASLSTQHTQHTATISTLQTQLTVLRHELNTIRAEAGRMRLRLEEAGRQAGVEAFGRRKEIAIRLALVAREEGVQSVLKGLVKEFEAQLKRENEYESLDGSQEQTNSTEITVHQTNSRTWWASRLAELVALLDGPEPSIPRFVLAQDAVRTLTEELNIEMERRMQLEGEIASLEAGREKVEKSDGAEDAVRVSVGVQTSRIGVNDSITSPSLSETDLLDKPSVAVETSTGLLQDQSEFGSQEESSESQDSGHAEESLISNSNDMKASTPTIPTPDGVRSTISTQESLPDIALPIISEEAPSTSSLEPDLPAHDSVSEIHSPIPIAPPATPSKQEELQPESRAQQLLADLHGVSKRYDVLQCAFYDCHCALREIRQPTLTTTSLSTSHSFPSSSLATPISIPTTVSDSVIQNALERLNDYIEDARVEIEIRIADEALAVRGYETLISVSGDLLNGASALATQKFPPGASSNQTAIECDIADFVNGTEPGVAKVLSNLQRKLEDVQHDLGALTHAVRNASLPEAVVVDATSFASAGHHQGPVHKMSSLTSPSTSSWTQLLGFASPVISPRVPSPAPRTFGDVMTSPRNAISVDPLAGLELRVSGPGLGMSAGPGEYTFGYHHSEPGVGMGHPSSPSGVGRGPRPRTISSIYMLGLGSGNGNGSRRMSRVGSMEVTMSNVGGDVVDGEDSDVE